MQITYQLTERDFRDGFMAYFKSRRGFRFVKPIIFVAIVITLLSTVLAIATSPCQRARLVMNLVPLYVLIALWAFILWGTPWLAARRQFRNQPAAKGEKTMTVTDMGIEWQGTTGKSESYWAAFIKWFETPALFVLFPSPAMFYMIPKRAFTLEQLTEFRQMLEQKIGPMNKQRKL